MATFSVQMEVNVPGLGVRTFTTTGIVAPTMEDAIAQAKTGIIVTALQAQRTAP